MKPAFLLLSFSLAISACDNSHKIDKPQTFKTFDFSYNDFFNSCFSIKFTHGDTAFIRQYFAPTFSDTPKSNQSYYALLADSVRQRIDSFINKINFAKVDTSYYQPYEDGIEFQFYIDKDSIQKIIYVHSDSIPDDIRIFAFWIANLKKKLELRTIDTTINFESVRHFLPPSVPTAQIKFTPPKVE